MLHEKQYNIDLYSGTWKIIVRASLKKRFKVHIKRNADGWTISE